MTWRSGMVLRGPLQELAVEFEVGHWIRFALGSAAAATSFMGFLKFYRYRILARYAHR